LQRSLQRQIAAMMTSNILVLFLYDVFGDIVHSPCVKLLNSRDSFNWNERNENTH